MGKLGRRRTGAYLAFMRINDGDSGAERPKKSHKGVAGYITGKVLASPNSLLWRDFVAYERKCWEIKLMPLKPHLTPLVREG